MYYFCKHGPVIVSFFLFLLVCIFAVILSVYPTSFELKNQILHWIYYALPVQFLSLVYASLYHPRWNLFLAPFDNLKKEISLSARDFLSIWCDSTKNCPYVLIEHVHI